MRIAIAIEKQLGVRIAYQDNYTQEGDDLIIAHGGKFTQALNTIAKEFPRTKFAVITRGSGRS